MNHFLTSLTQGTIQVGYLKDVHKEKELYLNLFRLRTDIEKEFIDRLIQARMTEIRFFENFLRDIQELNQLLTDTELGSNFLNR